MDLKDQLLQLKDTALGELKKVADPDTYMDLHTKYLGRKGELAKLAKGIKDLTDEQRPIIGSLINDVKEALETAMDEVKETVMGALPGSGAGSAEFDPTLPGTASRIGTLHTITQFIWEVEDIFRELGFGIVDGPEIDSEWYNFTALNVPHWHPARDMQDTFYVETTNNVQLTTNNPKTSEDNLVLRTQTSSVQVRAMEQFGVPLKIIVPGRVYRNEELDARHDAVFWQVEGLVVDKGISLAHLRGTMNYVIERVLGATVRWRPGYFPFVEPGIEMDIECLLCHGGGCRVCKGTGWLEFMGSGLVHPNVLESAGVDPTEYSGFAFGFGLERLHMLKYGVDDIRLYKSGDLRFLKQF